MAIREEFDMKKKTILFLGLCLFAVLMMLATVPGQDKRTFWTNRGPAMILRRQWDTGEHREFYLIHLFFKGHNNSYIWKTTFKDIPYDPDQNSWDLAIRVRAIAKAKRYNRLGPAYNYASALSEPVAYHSGDRIFLFYTGRDNRIWYTITPPMGGLHDDKSDSWTTPAYIPGQLTSSAPAVSSGIRGGVRVAFKGLKDNRIYLKSCSRADLINEPVLGESIWGGIGQSTLPGFIQSSVGPYMFMWPNNNFVVYRGVGKDAQVYIARAYNDSLGSFTRFQIPYAFTKATPVATMHYETDELKRLRGDYPIGNAIHVAYVGHNNDYIWLCVSPDRGETWWRLGYIEGISTRHRPALLSRTVEGKSLLYLAFKPVNSLEVSVGRLEIDYSNRPDTAGHKWTSLRPQISTAIPIPKVKKKKFSQ